MTTRLRKQAERRREKQREKETEEREPEGQITETISISDEGEEDRRPSHWGVEQVFSYINSLPGNLIFLSSDFQHHITLLNLTHKYGAEEIKHKHFNTNVHFQLFLDLVNNEIVSKKVVFNAAFRDIPESSPVHQMNAAGCL